MEAVIIPRNLPVGYRFHPTDEEFIDHYLRNRVLGYIDHPCVIPDVDICRWDPWVLPRVFHGESIIPPDDKVQEWWFFCSQIPQKAKRSTPSGYWKKTGPDRNVKAGDTDRVIGTKKILVFHIGQGLKGIGDKWVIHEYHLLTKDLIRNYVLCCLKHTRDGKADNSTVELAHGAINLADWDSDLQQPDTEDSLPEPWIQEMVNSMIDPPFQPENQVQLASFALPELLQPAQRSQNSLPSNIYQFINTESGFSLENDIIDESIQLESLFGTSEEDEDFGSVLIEDLSEEDEDFGNVLIEDLSEEVEDAEVLSGDLFYDNFFNGEQMQTGFGQTSNLHDERPVLMENRRTRTISVHGVVPLEKKEGKVENKFNGSLVAPGKPTAPPLRAASKDEEPRSEKVTQETATKNIKRECIFFDEPAAKAKVLEYKEHGSAGNSPKKTNSKEIEHAREKSNSETALTRPTSKSTESSTSPRLLNLMNLLVGIFLLISITRQVLNF